MRKQGVIFRASTHRRKRHTLDFINQTKKYIYQRQSSLLVPTFLIILFALLLSPIKIQGKTAPPQEPIPNVTKGNSTRVNTHTDKSSEETSVIRTEIIENTLVEIDTIEAQLAEVPSPTVPVPPSLNTTSELYGFVSPLSAFTSITSHYSYSHPGIDLSAPSGTPIQAIQSGTIIESGWSNQGYGLTVVIDHGNGMTSLYAHLSSVAVSYGQSISTGAYVGSVGCTGWCTGNHLHIEIHRGGQSVNPFSYLPL